MVNPVGKATLSVRHSAVPGRLRVAVLGLKRNPRLERAVLAALSRLDGVRSVSTSISSGNALITFDGSRWEVAGLLSAAEAAIAGQTAAEAIEHGVAPRPASKPAWHAVASAEVARILGVAPEVGLDAAEAARRLDRFGPNRLPEPEDPSALKLIGRQLMNAPTLLLGAGSLLSLATGAVADALLIGGVLLANALIGAATERTGQRAIAALRRAVSIKARARRDGTVIVLDAEQLVPGDTILLLPGDPVPADARLWDAHRLEVEESALTGESGPVPKAVDPVPAESPLADRRCMLYRGAAIVSGYATAVVVRTGSNTVIGELHLAAAMAEPPSTPLKRDLAGIGRSLAIASVAVSAGVTALSLARGVSLRAALTTAVALGVAALPEGLPATATTVLALSSGRMREKGTLIRSLRAAEALGSVTVVCVDKTGTITENKMSVREIQVDARPILVTGPPLSPEGSLRVDGHPIRPEDDPALARVLEISALCSDAEIVGRMEDELKIDGSPTEAALLVAAVKAGLDVTGLRQRYPRIDRRDRGDGRRYMVTVHRGPNGLLALAKGGPEDILEMCDRILIHGQVVPLEAAEKAEIRRRNAEMARRAMRVLAAATRDLPDEYQEQDLREGFTWCGLAGLADPVRPSAPTAIQALRKAGIRTVMVTGDQAATASAVARQVGLEADGRLHMLEAGDLVGMDPEILRGLVGHVELFARTPPEMKLAIVRALQANGEVVAMTGDGVNDAPALRAADVGVAMGQRGTELARELADVVLSTDDLSQVVSAIEEGRLVRANVRRVLHYLLATNGSEVWAVAAAAALGLPLPLTPGQLLWLNLISDLAPAVGLAMEPEEPGIMECPPEPPGQPIIPGPFQRQILEESAALAAGPTLAYWSGLLRRGASPASRGMAFWSLALADLLHVALARSGSRPALRHPRRLSQPVAVGVGISALLQLGVLVIRPLRTFLAAGSLSLSDALFALVGALAPLAAIEARRSAKTPALLRPGKVQKQEERGPQKEAA